MVRDGNSDSFKLNLFELDYTLTRSSFYLLTPASDPKMVYLPIDS